MNSVCENPFHVILKVLICIMNLYYKSILCTLLLLFLHLILISEEFDFQNYKIAMRFRSNKKGTGRGYLIRGSQIPCSDSKSSPPYISNSAAYPSYSNYYQRPRPVSPFLTSYLSHVDYKEISPNVYSLPSMDTYSSRQSSNAFNPFLFDIHSRGNYSSLYERDNCDMTIKDTFFEIKSPNYPYR